MSTASSNFEVQVASVARGQVGGDGASSYSSAARVFSLMLRARGIDASAVKAIADLLKLRNIGAGSLAAAKYLAIVALVAEAFAAWYCAFQCDEEEEAWPC